MKEIVRALTGAAAIYNAPLSADRLNGYLAILKDYRTDTVVEAITMAVKGCKMFPTPADIIEHISAIANSRRLGQVAPEVEFEDGDREKVLDFLEDFKRDMRWE